MGEKQVEIKIVIPREVKIVIPREVKKVNNGES